MITSNSTGIEKMDQLSNYFRSLTHVPQQHAGPDGPGISVLYGYSYKHVSPMGLGKEGR
jgi:hypothetical protein